MTTIFNDWLAQLSRDGRGGPAAVLPSVSRGRGLAFRFDLASHTEFGDYTAGTFSASIRAAPDSDTELAAFTVTTGTPAGGITPVELVLSAAAQLAFPPDNDGDGLEHVVYELVYTPPSSDAVPIAGGLLPIAGAV